MGDAASRLRDEVDPVSVVGVGASAGGLAAIQTFFEHLPEDPGAAFVIAQHLSPDFKSLMHEILVRHTDLQVVRAEEDHRLERNTVYLMQPRADLRIEGDILRVVERVPEPGAVPHPIDALFESMATLPPGRGIGVLLSGTGTDGSRGLRRLKEIGGVVLVQSPGSAEFDGMPRAAIATGCVDFILEPREIAEKVGTLVSLPGVTPDRGSQVPPPPYDKILGLIKQMSGYDLSAYKPGTIGRRIERRMAMHSLHEIGEYIHLLEEDREEVALLARDCLIHVTYFFRDAPAFEVLDREIRSLVKEEPERREPIRVWVVGCSTGEEVYSIATLTDRAIREAQAPFDYKVFATDLDAEALAVASLGRYPSASVIDIPPALKTRLVTEADGVCQVVPEIRNRVVFARHDVLRDPPFPRIDIISCRNLLIYLSPDAQKAALERLAFSLRRGGLLFLGSSETVESLGDTLSTVHGKHRIYRKSADGAKFVFGAPRPLALPTVPVRPRGPDPADLPVARACGRLVDLFASAGVILTESGQVAHSFGEVNRWLRIPGGQMSSNLVDLVPDPVRAAALLGLRRARQQREAVVVGPVSTTDGSTEGTLHIAHVPARGALPGLGVLLFRVEESNGTETRALTDGSLDASARRQIEFLEDEVKATRANLQSTIQELETTNEELQSVNEELLASNEELQSTNQELHSVNEELYTVNTEHQQKIAELVEVTQDLEHLLQATEIGTLFLDRELTVRRFTASVRSAIPLREEDIGRPLDELATNLEGPLPLAELIREVMASGENVERRILTREGVPILLGIHPYRHGTTGGAVLTFVDVSNIEAVERKSVEHARMLRKIADTSRDVFWVVDAEMLTVKYVSPAYETVWGRPAEECLDDPMGWTAAIHPEERTRVEKEYAGTIRTGGFDCEYRIIRPDGTTRWIHHRMHGRVPDAEDDRAVVVSVAADVTARVDAERLRRRGFELHRLAHRLAPVPLLLIQGGGGRIAWRNDAAARMLGSAPASILDALANAEERDRWRRRSRPVLDGERETAALVVELAETPGSTVRCQLHIARVAGGEEDPHYLVCQLVDLSEHESQAVALAARAEALENEALHDHLTGLLNRRGASRHVARVLAQDRRRHESTMAILVDCDEFKSINDSRGYSAGDAVLREIAKRIRTTLRPEDVVARVGGDEFLVVLSATRLAEAAHVAEKLRRRVSGEPVRIGAQGLTVTVSLGVVVVPKQATDVDAVVAAAENLLQSSKLRGRDCVTFDSDGADASMSEDAFESVLENVSVVRQSLHEVSSGALVGYELLSRGLPPWRTPATMFALSRRHGRLEDLDLRCMERCLARARTLQGELRLHVNVFPSTLLDGKWKSVLELLEKIERPERICLELSEQQFLGESGQIRSRLAELRERGFGIALDDVGFGRSALETLLAVEPDVVKIDRQLVEGVDQDRGRRRVLSRLVTLLEGLHPLLIAEGVECAPQRDTLAELGVPYAQGFYWSNPDHDDR